MKYFLASLMLLVSSSGLAQSLADLLPAESFLVLGASDVAAHEEKLEPFIAEFERLDLGTALIAAFAADTDGATGADASEDAEPVITELDERLESLKLLDIIGQDAWIALSASSFNPLPALTLIATVSPEASTAVSELIAELENLETLEENGYTFYQQRLEGADSLVQVLAFAQDGDTLMLSSNPDTLRGVLRQLSGSSDPSFTAGEGYGASLGSLGDANFTGYLDFSQVVNVLQPYAQGFGFDQLIERVAQALDTAGVTAGALRVTDEGLESESRQILNPAGGDAELIALLSGDGAAADTLSAAPVDALSASTAALDLSAWWDYLNGISASSPELGGDLDSLAELFLGVDVRTTLLSWLGGNVTTISTGLGEVAEPGVASSNLLGESVYILATDDEAAAVTGLNTLFSTAGTALSGFTDPSGTGSAVEPSVSQIAGLDVSTYAFSDGIELSYAVADGQVYIATTQDALSTVLASEGAFSDVPEVAALLADVPGDASSISLTNNRETLAGTANQIASQIQMTAGIGGASQLDFDAVDEASVKLEEFLSFVAERLGYSSSYSQSADNQVSGFSKTTVNW